MKDKKKGASWTSFEYLPPGHCFATSTNLSLYFGMHYVCNMTYTAPKFGTQTISGQGQRLVLKVISRQEGCSFPTEVSIIILFQERST